MFTLAPLTTETATAIPSVGLQLTTQRGLVLPSLRSIFSRSSRSSKSEEPTQRVWTTSKQTTLIPRDRMLDLFVNEGFRRWAAISYLAVATKLPPSEVGVDAEKATEQKEGKLAVLFPVSDERALHRRAED